MLRKIIASLVALLLLQATFISGLNVVDGDASFSSTVSKLTTEAAKSRDKRDLGALLVPIIQNFCTAQCAIISAKVENELLKAMLPCSSVCTLINVVVKSATGGIAQLTSTTSS